MKSRQNERGSISGWMIAAISLIVLVLAAGAFGIWAYMNYQDQKTNVDGRVDSAVAKAKNVQAEQDEAKFLERDKQPNRQFVGPDDYGRLTFDYPKTWSVYVAKDGTSGTNGTSFEAYLNPVSVPPVSLTMRVALRITIEGKDYDAVLQSYESLVKKGNLKSSSVSVDGANGTRLDGNFTKDIRGAAVIYKIRDKTVTIRTDADTFKPDFEALIKTIKFNQ